MHTRDCETVTDRVREALEQAGVDPVEVEELGAPVLVSDLYEVACRMGCSAADFLMD